MCMSNEFKTKAENYLFNRNRYREICQTKFLSENEDINLLTSSTNELVASLTLFLNEVDISHIINGQYQIDLMVSFCRSHLISSDLILAGELIEAAVITRKQIELVARLNEISQRQDIESIIRRTPNVGHLKTSLNSLYGIYSEVSHSASEKVMQLLGSTENEKSRDTNLYPEFQRNSYKSMHHLVATACEYYLWCVSFFEANFQNYDGTYDSKLLEVILDQNEKMFPQNT